MTAPKALQGIERLGWVEGASPISELPELAGQLGLGYLAVKRDDLIAELHGGMKVRKLDYLLAAPPYREAARWAAMGAIGSGQLVALTAAAAKLDSSLDAYMFWEPPSKGVLDNLAFVASDASRLRFYRGRLSMALCRPGLLLSSTMGGAVVVPPGATSPRGLLGLVHAAFELRRQIENEELPRPDVIVLPYGTGGAAAGLSVGLAVAGLDIEVLAVAAVEGWVATAGRLGRLQRGLIALLVQCGVVTTGDLQPAPITIESGAIGRGYGIPTPESIAACQRIEPHGITLEPVYTGKAMAALLSRRWPAGAKVLFWNSARRDPLPCSENWREKLPRSLARRLQAAEAEAAAERKMGGRRRFLIGAGAVAMLAGAYRISGYPEVGWQPKVLYHWEVSVLTAVAEVALSPFASAVQIAEVAPRIDRYLRGMPAKTIRELHGGIALVEHGTTALGASIARFSNADRAARERLFARLQAIGGLIAQAYQAVRQLCMFGYYQQSSTWPALGYGGPLLAKEGAARQAMKARYEPLRAPRGTEPKAAQR